MNMVYAMGNLKQLCMNQLEEYYCKYTSCCITFVDPIYKIVIRIICWTTIMEESSFGKSLYLTGRRYGDRRFIKWTRFCRDSQLA